MRSHTQLSQNCMNERKGRFEVTVTSQMFEKKVDKK